MRRPALVLVPLVLLALGSAAPASAATPPRTVRLISGGGSSTDNAFSAAISADGSRAVFTTTEKLLPADVNAVSDVYARDTNGTLQLVSSGKGSSGASFLAVSANGDRIVYFTPNAELPSDTDAQGDLYERRRSGALRQISAGNGAFGVTFIAQSDNGDHVVFVSSENISGTGDSDGQQDFFDRRADGSIRLLTPGTPSTVPLVFGPLALSSDGSTLFIHTTDALAPADADVAFDTYSVPTAGGPYTLLTPGTTTGTFAFASRDGRRVWFTATDALLPADTDTATDIYERDAGGAIKLISGGTANTSAALITTLVDGSVIFSTAEKLLPAMAIRPASTSMSVGPTDSLRLISGGSVDADSADLVGVNATARSCSSPPTLLPSDTDAQLDLYIRRPDGTLALVTPGTPTRLRASPGRRSATRARTAVRRS